jgi:type III pantothenate kinase
MVKIIADIGNTSLKLACFRNRDLLKALRVAPDQHTAIEEALLKLLVYNPEKALWASVNGRNSDLEKCLKRAEIPSEQITRNWHTGLKNKYLSPETLGIDRIANAVAAATIYPAEPVVIVDAGTCIKFDFINKQHEYFGGSISPGIDMRFRALHTFTGALPLLERSEEIFLIGRNTKESIVSGVINGALAEVNGILEQYLMTHKNLRIILTGGDQSVFERSIKFSFLSEPWLTLKGLNEIHTIHEGL